MRREKQIRSPRLVRFSSGTTLVVEGLRRGKEMGRRERGMDGGAMPTVA